MNLLKFMNELFESVSIAEKMQGFRRIFAGGGQ